MGEHEHLVEFSSRCAVLAADYAFDVLRVMTAEERQELLAAAEAGDRELVRELFTDAGLRTGS